MWRIWIPIIMGGIALTTYGCKEARLGGGASSRAVDVDLADLEKGQRPPDRHIRIGRHLCLYPAVVLCYDAPGSPNDNTRVEYAWYPILSEDHPVLLELARLEEKHGNIDAIPEKELPQLKTVAALVKTKRFATIGRIPDITLPSNSVQGVVLNGVESLVAEERRLVRESFSGMDFGQVVLLDADRLPSSPLVGIVFMFLGVCVVGVGAGAPIYLDRQKKKEAARLEARRRARLAKARENVRALAAEREDGDAGAPRTELEKRPAPPRAAARRPTTARGTAARRRRRRFR